MSTNRVRLLGLSIAIFLLSALPVFAAGVRVVRLSLAQGDVQIDRNSGDGWEQAINNMPVIGGARIYAAENSKAELEFEDGSSVRLAGPAQITVTELSTSPKGNPVNVIQVDSGMVYVNARLANHDDFRVSASSGEIYTITQPSHLRFRIDQQVASVSVVDGEVSIQNGSANTVLRRGSTYNNVIGQPESAARQENVPPEPEDTWNQERDTYDNQYASDGAQTGTDDPNAAGAADLGYYGTYSNIPGYGEAWQPSGVGPDWDPYGYGAWSYYPGWGWTFVSGYPWGWAPFFYGDWCYINGRGWWWRPGGWGRGGFHGRGPHLPGGGGWHPQPRFVGHPGTNWSAPHPPASRAGHGTVAVAGSHLPVGPIGVTHAPGAIHGNPAQAANSTRGVNASHGFVGGTSSLAQGSAERVGPASRSNMNSNLSIVGRQGAYAVNGSNSGRNGYEVHRPPSGYTPRSSGIPANSYTSGVIPHGGSISSYPRPATATPAPAMATPRATTATPPPAMTAPHVSVGPVGGGSASHSGGAFGGGSAAGSHSGGAFGGGAGGGGSHGGGGGHR